MDPEKYEKKFFEAEVMNCADYAMDCEFIVARLSENVLWFYGAYNDLSKAREAARKIGSGVVVFN